MQDDDELCLCFHVTRRKVKNFIRVERPRVASQLSECGGAGTGCGWCRPMLRRLLSEAPGAEQNGAEQNGSEAAEPWPDAETYASQRADYRASKRDGAAG